MKKVLIILGIVLLLIIAYLTFQIVSNKGEHFITHNEFLYDKAISYLEAKEEEKYSNNLLNYKVFTDYHGFGITEKDDKKYAYMKILLKSCYTKDNEIKIYQEFSTIYKFTFVNNEVVDYRVPMEGGYYASSIEEMIPNSIKNKVLRYQMDDSKLEQKVDKYYDNINNNSEDITMEVLQDTVTNKSLEIKITDNTEKKYNYGAEYKIQKKVNGQWEDLEYKPNDLYVIDIASNLKEKTQQTEKLDIEKYYGKLSNGIYRIKKKFYNQGFINIYSNEFEIK